MAILSSDKLSDLMVATTCDLQTSLISLSVNQAGSPERMIQQIQILMNDFRARIFSNLIIIIQHLNDKSHNSSSINTNIVNPTDHTNQNKESSSTDQNMNSSFSNHDNTNAEYNNNFGGFSQLKDVLENNINKYNEISLLYQMRAIVNSQIRSVFQALAEEPVNSDKRQHLLSQLATYNDSLAKIERNLNQNQEQLDESGCDNSNLVGNSFQHKRSEILMNLMNNFPNAGQMLLQSQRSGNIQTGHSQFSTELNNPHQINQNHSNNINNSNTSVYLHTAFSNTKNSNYYRDNQELRNSTGPHQSHNSNSHSLSKLITPVPQRLHQNHHLASQIDSKLTPLLNESEDNNQKHLAFQTPSNVHQNFNITSSRINYNNIHHHQNNQNINHYTISDGANHNQIHQQTHEGGDLKTLNSFNQTSTEERLTNFPTTNAGAFLNNMGFFSNLQQSLVIQTNIQAAQINSQSSALQSSDKQSEIGSAVGMANGCNRHGIGADTNTLQTNNFSNACFTQPLLSGGTTGQIIQGSKIIQSGTGIGINLAGTGAENFQHQLMYPILVGEISSLIEKQQNSRENGNSELYQMFDNCLQSICKDQLMTQGLYPSNQMNNFSTTNISNSILPTSGSNMLLFNTGKSKTGIKTNIELNGSQDTQTLNSHQKDAIQPLTFSNLLLKQGLGCHNQNNSSSSGAGGNLFTPLIENQGQTKLNSGTVNINRYLQSPDEPSQVIKTTHFNSISPIIKQNYDIDITESIQILDQLMKKKLQSRYFGKIKTFSKRKGAQIVENQDLLGLNITDDSTDKYNQSLNLEIFPLESNMFENQFLTVQKQEPTSYNYNKGQQFIEDISSKDKNSRKNSQKQYLESIDLELIKDVNENYQQNEFQLYSEGEVFSQEDFEDSETQNRQHRKDMNYFPNRDLNYNLNNLHENKIFLSTLITESGSGLYREILPQYSNHDTQSPNINGRIQYNSKEREQKGQTQENPQFVQRLKKPSKSKGPENQNFEEQQNNKKVSVPSTTPPQLQVGGTQLKKIQKFIDENQNPDVVSQNTFFNQHTFGNQANFSQILENQNKFPNDHFLKQSFENLFTSHISFNDEKSIFSCQFPYSSASQYGQRDKRSESYSDEIDKRVSIFHKQPDFSTIEPENVNISVSSHFQLKDDCRLDINQLKLQKQAVPNLPRTKKVRQNSLSGKQSPKSRAITNKFESTQKLHQRQSSQEQFTSSNTFQTDLASSQNLNINSARNLKNQNSPFIQSSGVPKKTSSEIKKQRLASSERNYDCSPKKNLNSNLMSSINNNNVIQMASTLPGGAIQQITAGQASTNSNGLSNSNSTQQINQNSASKAKKLIENLATSTLSNQKSKIHINTAQQINMIKHVPPPTTTNMDALHEQSTMPNTSRSSSNLLLKNGNILKKNFSQSIQNKDKKVNNNKTQLIQSEKENKENIQKNQVPTNKKTISTVDSDIKFNSKKPIYQDVTANCNQNPPSSTPTIVQGKKIQNLIQLFPQ